MENGVPILPASKALCEGVSTVLSKVFSLQDILEHIHDGQTIMFGDWHGQFAADEIIDGMLEKGVRISKLSPYRRAIPARAWQTHRGPSRIVHRTTHIGLNPEALKQMLAGELAVEFVPLGTGPNRCACGGAGLGGVLTPTGVRTSVEEGKQKLVIDGKEYLLELPPMPTWPWSKRPKPIRQAISISA